MSEATFEVPPGLPDIVSLGIRLWGEPTERTPGKVLFGAHGSKCIRPAPTNTWFDHEARVGGGYIDIYKLNFGKLPEAKPSNKRIVETYDYVNADGQLLFQVVRYEPKDFRQRRPDGKGGWIWKMDGVEKVLYRLPQVIAAIADTRLVFVAEGEKGVAAIERLGFTGTCSPGGAGKWRGEYSPWLRDADVILLGDNDDAGRKHVEQVAGFLRGIAGRVRVLALPGLPEKGDVADWIAAGGTASALAELVAQAPEWTPSPKAQATEPEPPTKRARRKARQPDVAAILEGYDLTEDGIALAFAAKHQDLLRYDHSIGKWFQWTGKAWRQDEVKLGFSWSRRMCRQLAKEAGTEGGQLATLAKASTAAAVERFSQSDPALAVTSAIWDNDPFLLGTPGGTLDLHTAELRDPVREDHITKLTSVAPSMMPDCPQWLAFLDQATKSDAGLIRFLKQWCGYCLTGDIREHALVFAHGPGGNGKGVFLNVVRSIMGDYAKNAAMDTFTASDFDKHTTDLAMLRGARLVTASETEEGRAWAEKRIKELTGGDPITARFMRQDNFTFQPQFKLTIIGNHKPILRNVDDAARRRINMVPFLYKPPVTDKELEAKLLKEAPGILRWMIEGCLDWQKNGLIQPGVVVQATAEYFSEQDTVNQWVEDCCVIGATQSDTLAILFRSWSDYALANGEKPGTTKWFTQTLTRLGCEAVKHTPGNNAKRGFKGIGVKIVKPVDRTQPTDAS